MDTLFHFVFPLIALLAARVKIKHKISTMIFLALIASVFIDLDHLEVFGLVTRATFHNIFVTVLIPVIFIILAFMYEKKGTYYKHITLALLLVMFSHPIADLFTEGGVQLLYPLSTHVYDLTGNKFSWTIGLPAGTGYIISTAGVGLTIYFLMILGVIFIEDFLKVLKKHRIPSKALWKTIEKEERKIEREL